MFKNLLLVLTVLLISLSCTKEGIDSKIDQPVVFEFEYVNHAWGYNHLGWMIDDEGTVHGFNLPENWNQPDENYHITKDELEENLSQSDTIYLRVNSLELFDHYSKRKNMQGARMDTSGTSMADAGIGALYVYVWDRSAAKYEKVLLASKGDISVTNTNNQAKSAVKWLKTIGDQTDRFLWFD